MSLLTSALEINTYLVVRNAELIYNGLIFTNCGGLYLDKDLCLQIRFLSHPFNTVFWH